MKTINQIRDEVAALLGWVPPIPGNPFSNWHRMNSRQELETKGCGQHPVPATIDGIAEMMPDGLRLNLTHLLSGEWAASAISGWEYAGMVYGSTEYEARLRLIHEVLGAKKGPR